MEAELSSRAARCRDERLPGLLAAMRRRRVARRRGQAAILVAIVAALPAAWWWRAAAPGTATDTPPMLATIESGSRSAVVHDDPTVFERCAVGSIECTAWYVDDDGLQQLLQQAGLESGLIRAGGRLLAVAAVDAVASLP